MASGMHNLTSESFRSAFISGTRDILPILPGFFSFGVVAGLVAIDVGFSPIEAMAMSIIVYSGAGQLTALELINTHAPVIIIVVTALIVNVRFMMYSASIASYFERFPIQWKGFLSYFLITPNYALPSPSSTMSRQRATAAIIWGHPFPSG